MTKKLTRSDVEELAAYASQRTYAGYCPPTLPIPPGTLAELARVWLTVDSAPVVELDTTHTPFGIVLAAVVDDQPGTWATGMKVRVIREHGDQP